MNINLDYDDLLPFIILSLIICFGIFIYFESKKDFEFWKKENNYIVYNKCCYHNGKYYCVVEK